MTGRERIRETLNHREPEGLAIDFGGMRSTGIHMQAYLDLVRGLGMNLPPPKLYDVFQQLAEPQQEVLERLGGDVVQAHQRAPAFGIPIDEGWKEIRMRGQPVLAPRGYNPVDEGGGNEYIYQNGVKWAYKPANSLYFDQVAHPYQGCETPGDVDSVPLAPLSGEDLDFIAQGVRHLYETTDKAILLAVGGNIFEAGQLDFGYEDFFVNLLAEKDLMHHYFNRLTDVYMQNLENLLPRVAEYGPVLQFGDDLGTQQAPQISPEMYREMIKPYHARQYRYVRNRFPACKVFLHCCGAVEPLIPDLIDAGVEVLNPVQITARGMDPRHLKKEYGAFLSFWGGGARTQTTMLSGTPEQNRRETRELIEIFAPGGGYVFTQVHNIQPGVPVENILAVYDTALAERSRRGNRNPDRG